MTLDIDDCNLRARINPLRNGLTRLTIDYPAEYQERVFDTLTTLIRPRTANRQRNRRTTKEANNVPASS